ncbi:rhomboid family intramembrane serine protease [Mucilaginibacter daejeonensis]|uniref:rhomboid family intramembrane serine protease n=1 Tax=Mucilaginibacter daejeonensis TaxID=398049 RepID=UPI001D175AD3|nr:rhomboid family intramembrane serine protease [Mucilaginibacter daejeonensis]UEG51924.1 rhomboid family intramembrane serine protease [Mucilaginibacter daejeonensis]
MGTSERSVNIEGLGQKRSLVSAFGAIESLDWRTRFLSDAGVIAYSNNAQHSWNGEFTINVGADQMHIKCVPISSLATDSGQAERAIDQFEATFTELSTTLTEDEVHERYKAYEKDFIPPYEDTLKPDIRPKFGAVGGFFSFFKPTENYFFTPILVIINVLIFLIMVCSGVSVFEPTGPSVLAWGANSTTTTLDGQWWRLLTNCFIHFGIIHLALNMYALVFVGVLLEPFLGKVKFLTAYILTGIAASAVSIWWHDQTISAGASGAIFGFYGVFLAILSTNHVERSMRNGLLANIGMFVIYNLVYGGLKSGIDNAAHIGGLLSGAVVGYIYLPGLKRPDDRAINKRVTIAASVVIMAGTMLACVYTSRSGNAIYFKRIDSFFELEEKAVKIVNDTSGKPLAEALPALQKGIVYWNQGINLIKDLDKLDVSNDIHQRNKGLIKYCQLRIQSYRLMYDAYASDSQPNSVQMANIDKQIKQSIDELSSK